jgi:uncharacterized protein YutE (UPF0331/DUF86 family)
MLRPEFVARKLQLIAQDLGILAEFRDTSYEDLVGSPIRLAAVERIIERIILRAVDVNEHLIGALATGAEAKATRLTYRDTFLKLEGLGVCSRALVERLASSAGLRNILVHEYNDVDHRIVHAAIRSVLEDYTSYLEAVHRFVTARG